MHLAQRVNRLGTETAFEVLVRARALEAQGKNIVHLEIGEPDFDTPLHIKDAAKKALDDGFTHYGASAGMIELRTAIVKDFAMRRGVEYSPDEVVVTPGAKPIIFYSMLATVDEGDEVIYQNPGFPIYESAIEFIGAKGVPLELKEENNFRIDIADLEKLITPRTRMMVLNTPQNPTGGILTRDDLGAIAEIAVKNDIIVFSDEIYGRITYDGFKHTSITTFPGMKERTIVLDGFSKTFAMTGWRMGYGLMPKHIAQIVAKLQTNCTSCTSSFTQVAGISALTGPQEDVDAMVKEFKVRRDLIVDGLNAIPGISCHKPSGAFYVFPNISKTGKKSKELADYLLNEGVACLAGTSFGKFGEGYLRFSYANSQENIKEALRRIKAAVEKL